MVYQLLSPRITGHTFQYLQGISVFPWRCELSKGHYNNTVGDTNDSNIKHGTLVMSFKGRKCFI